MVNNPFAIRETTEDYWRSLNRRCSEIVELAKIGENDEIIESLNIELEKETYEAELALRFLARTAIRYMGYNRGKTERAVIAIDRRAVVDEATSCQTNEETDLSKTIRRLISEEPRNIDELISVVKKEDSRNLTPERAALEGYYANRHRNRLFDIAREVYEIN
ncbi:MAG: hypothetical protein ACP5NS_00090 [Candidatus Pacearchaeota archaeon]